MSSLTEQERLGLEEVFLSISSNRKSKRKLPSLKENFSMLLKSEKVKNHFSKPSLLLKKTQKRLKKANFFHLFPKKSKKKKNLS